MCVSRAICAILLVLKLSFQNCPTFKQRFGAPLRWRPPPPPPHCGVSGALCYATGCVLRISKKYKIKCAL